jgi:hypothetical protein
MNGLRESQSIGIASFGELTYGFFVSSAVLPDAGEQLIPANGLSGLTRGEQCWASGAAFSPPACDPAGG